MDASGAALNRSSVSFDFPEFTRITVERPSSYWWRLIVYFEALSDAASCSRMSPRPITGSNSSSSAGHKR